MHKLALESSISENSLRMGSKLDGWYVEHLSFGLDVKCFFGTIAAVLRHDGVVEGGTGTLHEETGKENH